MTDHQAAEPKPLRDLLEGLGFDPKTSIVREVMGALDSLTPLGAFWTIGILAALALFGAAAWFWWRHRPKQAHPIDTFFAASSAPDSR